MQYNIHDKTTLGIRHVSVSIPIFFFHLYLDRSVSDQLHELNIDNVTDNNFQEFTNLSLLY